MRLLNVHTFEFQTFLGEDVPNYSIASHRWVSDECTIKDIIKKRNTESNGYKKVAGFATYVKEANALYKDSFPDLVCDYLWIDTVCIDQKSSLEVDTAIRSMFQWYNKSVICYAYLADVEPLAAGNDVVEASLRKSVWFSRGWTLQELLAPRTVVFLTKNWEVIGHKCTSSAITDGGQCPGVGHRLNGMISEITGIPELVLYDYPRSKELSIEERMSWSAKRKTTRQEDSVYCLLGIFEIHMPVMYGEGDFAQIRLRSEIEKKMEAWEKGQRAGAQTTYNTHAPCAVVKTTSHLPTVSQRAHDHLPQPIEATSGASAASVSASHFQEGSDVGTSTTGSVRADDVADGLGSLQLQQSKGRLASGATPSGNQSATDDEPMFKPPPRSMTFNNLREPYARNSSTGYSISTNAWTEEPEEEERTAKARPPVPTLPTSQTAPQRMAPPPPPPKAASPPSSSSSHQASSQPAPARQPSQTQADTEMLPPPPDYDSIWSENNPPPPPRPEKTPSVQPPAARAPTWSSSESYSTAPSRAGGWNAGNRSPPPMPTSQTSRDAGSSDYQSQSRYNGMPPDSNAWSPPSNNYAMPTREDMRAPPRPAASTVGDLDGVPLSTRAQRKLNHAIAKEERRDKRRERRAKRHGNGSSAATGATGANDYDDDDYSDGEDDLMSNADSTLSGSTDPRSYGSGDRFYNTVQDARRQDARRRFFGSGSQPTRTATGSTTTESAAQASSSASSVGRPPNRQGSIADFADSLPSGLKLTRTALRMLDSGTRSGSNEDISAPTDANTTRGMALQPAPSEAGTATRSRTKPLGRRELKQILKERTSNLSPTDENGRKLTPRDRLLSAVSSHLRNP